MNIPRLVEFIESVQKPTGGFCAEAAFGQIRYTDLPPDSVTTVTIRPAESEYAYFAYHIDLSQRMVPNAFYITIQQLGHTVYMGYLSDIALKKGGEFFVVLTRDAPGIIRSENLSGLVQFVDITYSYAMVRTIEDYNIIMNALDALAGKGIHEEKPLPEPLPGGAR